MSERRNSQRRARTVQLVLDCLRKTDGECTTTALADAIGGAQPEIAHRVVKRLAIRGLVRHVAADRWVAGAPLKAAARLTLSLIEVPTPES